MKDEEALRQKALAVIKNKREFLGHLLAYVVVNAVLVAIWAQSDVHSFFWPILPIIGWGIGILFHALDVYSRQPSEAEIRKEMDNLRRLR